MIVIICSEYTREMKTYGLHLGAGMDGLMVGAEVGAEGDIGNDGIIGGGCGNGCDDDGNIGGGGDTGGSCRYRETSCAKRRQSA